MDQQLRPTSLGPGDTTLAAEPDAALSSASWDRACRVHLVEGSDVGLSGEEQSLLRTRLRSAALLLFGGFSIFLLWHITELPFKHQWHLIKFVVHVAATLTLGGIALSLCSQCTVSTSRLRWLELLTFGLPVGVFALLNYDRSVEILDRGLTNPGIPSAWVVPLFIYAIFIPNHWRRAAVVISCMAVVPLLAALVTTLRHPAGAAYITEHLGAVVETVLAVAVSAAGAIWGVYTINNLQDAVYQARQMGQYRLKHLIGSGGMGEVYLAEHLLMKRPCALKIIHPEKAGDPKVLARFEREVHTTAQLSHWNNIDIYDYGRTDDGTFYYVMEYLPGMSLADLVRQSGVLPAARVIHLVRQACDALQEAHGLGLLHRDLKPANLFASIRGGRHDVTKLLDFGLAKPLAGIDNANLTSDGMITGSPLYMSPEQATGDKEPDPRSDIYSLGGVIYYLLTGRPPFDDEKPLKVLIAHAHEMPQPPSKYRDDVPLDLEAVVMRCLQKNPDDRYQTVSELAAALDDCEQSNEWTWDDARRWWKNHESGAALSTRALVG